MKVNFSSKYRQVSKQRPAPYGFPQKKDPRQNKLPKVLKNIKFYKNNNKEITKNYCKSPSKELQYGYREGKTLLDHEIFFFLFLGYWARILLLRLFSFTAMIHAPHRQCPASCAKGLVRYSGRAFLHSASPVLPAKVILQ